MGPKGVLVWLHGMAEIVQLHLITQGPPGNRGRPGHDGRAGLVVSTPSTAVISFSAQCFNSLLCDRGLKVKRELLLLTELLVEL